MLQAMNTGHDGSLSTVHSNSPRDGLHRIETMVMMAGYDLPLRAIRQHIAAALDLLVHIDRMEDGSRRVVAITEVLRMESDVIQLQDIFEFEIDSVAPDRTITGGLKPTGLRPVFLEKFRKRGIELPAGHVRRARPLARRAQRRNGVKLGLRIAIASAALAALALPALAGGQGGSPTLTEAQDSEFPDRVWLYRTPTATKLGGLDVTENGGPVSGLVGRQRIEVERRHPPHRRVEQHGRRADRGRDGCCARVHGAAQGRACRSQSSRTTPRSRVLTDFTRDSGELSAAVAEAPPTAEGTRIYDALIEAARLAEEAGYARTTAVLLSDGHRRGVQATQRGDHRRRSTLPTCASSRSACSRPSTTPRRCGARRSRRAAPTSRARRRSSSSRSSRRSASSSRTSTSSAIARSSRPTSRPPCARSHRASLRRPRPIRRPRSTSRRRARSSAAGSTRRSRRRG